MRAYYEIDINFKSLILVLFFILNLFQYGYLILLIHYNEKKRAYRNVFPIFIIFFMLLFLSRSLYSDGGIFGQGPVAGILLFWILVFVYTITGIHSQIRKGHKMLTSQSVKEAADKLTGGLVYFSENGLTTLCNTQMQKLFYQMTGQDLQMKRELETALNKGNIYTFEDGSIWKFDKSVIGVDSDRYFTQFIASDVTELYRIRKKIESDNEKMQATIRRVQKITENIADITRQEEILTAKMRVHNKMGNCMLAARRYLMADCEHSNEEKRQLIHLWEDNLKELQNEVGANDTPDAYESVVQIAEKIGLDVILHGEMPQKQQTAYLLVVALRECVTNALNHAKAKRLDMTVSKTGEQFIACYTNDGILPKEKIIEGGGLSSLRAKIESSGGEMKVADHPVFMLTVSIPIDETKLL